MCQANSRRTPCPSLDPALSNLSAQSQDVRSAATSILTSLSRIEALRCSLRLLLRHYHDSAGPPIHELYPNGHGPCSTLRPDRDFTPTTHGVLFGPLWNRDYTVEEPLFSHCFLAGLPTMDSCDAVSGSPWDHIHWTVGENVFSDEDLRGRYSLGREYMATRPPVMNDTEVKDASQRQRDLLLAERFKRPSLSLSHRSSFPKTAWRWWNSWAWYGASMLVPPGIPVVLPEMDVQIAVLDETLQVLLVKDIFR